MQAPSTRVRRTLWSAAGMQDGERTIPEETAVALVHDASTTAVMMATPADLEDFAYGFTLTEGLVESISSIADVEIVEGELGVEARIWLKSGAGSALAARRRRIAGPTGCGLCGLDSLAEAVHAPRPVANQARINPGEVHEALAALGRAQALGAETRAAHAAGWWTSRDGLVMVREDVGRHNALDKLIGGLCRKDTPANGALLLTSRVSVEMVQKAAAFGAEIILAVSAPSALAVRAAEAAQQTLIAVARRDSFEVFTHAGRVQIG